VTSKKRVLVSGYFGFGNIGDEAILVGMLNDLRALHSGLEFIVVSGDPKRTRALHGTASVPWKDILAIVEAARQSDLLVSSGGLFQDYWGVDPETYLTREHGGSLFLRWLSPPGESAGQALYAVCCGRGTAAQ